MPPTFRKNHEVLLAREAQSPCVLPSTPFRPCCPRLQSARTITTTSTQTIPAGCFVSTIPPDFSSVTERASWLGNPSRAVDSSKALVERFVSKKISTPGAADPRPARMPFSLSAWTASNLLCDSHRSATKTALWRQVRASAAQIDATFDSLDPPQERASYLASTDGHSMEIPARTLSGSPRRMEA
ncbi:hypothetical protein LZ30DRAFT_50050 [Colletotrichum cereale]|nr:hypothetical protein LZ30DRAFT_50050 [Colletotrichum cereale]